MEEQADLARRLADRAVRGEAPRTQARYTAMAEAANNHAAILRDRLLRAGHATFRMLCSDCHNTLEVVARFLALLELYREGMVTFDQLQALGELSVRWTGGDTPVELDVDEYAGTPEHSVPPQHGGGDAGE